MMPSKLLRSPASFLFLLFSAASFAQNASLSLSSGTALANGGVSLDLTLAGGAQPAGLQWTLSYDTADFTAVDIGLGESASAASKSLNCFGGNGSYTCLLTGMSSSMIADGVVATVTLTLSASTTVSRAVQVADTMGASLSGDLITSTGTGGIVSLPAPVPDTEAPTTPGGLSASSLSSVKINLVWSASTDNVGVTGYWIERCQGTGCNTFTQIGSTSGTTYVDSGLTAGTEYRYQIRAVDAAGNLSGYSAVVSATTLFDALISGLSCTPVSLASGQAATCTVTLTKGAPTGGAAVKVSDDNANLTVPNSITISAGATTGSFTAAAGTIATDQTAVISVSYGGVSKTSSISLTSPAALISALSCTPVSLASGQAATCTVTLTKGAPTGGAAVSVSDNNGSLTVPTSVTVLAGATTGSFTAAAGTIATDQTATVTTSLNGGSKSVTVNLIAAVIAPSIWSSTSVPAVANATDTASIELGLKFRSSVAGYITGVRFYKGSGNTGNHVGSLWTNSGSRLARVSFNKETDSGWQQANFSTPVPINANTTYVVSYTAPKGRYALNTDYFAASGVTTGTLSGLKDGADGSNSVFLYGKGGFPNGTWKSSNYWVDVVFTAQQLTLHSAAPSKRTPAQIDLSQMSDVSERAVADHHSAGPALSCLPRVVGAGEAFSCSLRFDEERSADTGAIAVTASGTDVRLPAHINARAGQRSITFHGVVDKAASQSLVLIATGEGEAYAADQIAILPAGVPVINVPDLLYVKPGEPIAFTVTARDGGDLPVAIAAPELPPGATFEPAANHFAWTPSSNQEGEYALTFTAVNLAGASAKGQARIVVASGRPQLSGPAGLACTAGSIATIRGSWLSLADELISDQTGSSFELGGTTIRVNGNLVPILSVSPTRVEFLCPNNSEGQAMNVVLETAKGVSAPLPIEVGEVNPILLSADGSDSEGLIKVAGTNRLTVVRDVRGAGEPAQTDDLVMIHATGLGRMATEIASMVVKIGNIEARVESVLIDPVAAGVFQLLVKVPAAAGTGDAVPVQMTLRAPTGRLLTSNTVTMAIE
jgi:uncharacterized protein (TIGR03437 family)